MEELDAAVAAWVLVDVVVVMEVGVVTDVVVVVVDVSVVVTVVEVAVEVVVVRSKQTPKKHTPGAVPSKHDVPSTRFGPE